MNELRLFVGTSGFSYKSWKGHFYPVDLPEKRFLSFYASKLSSVELNNTFYRMPRVNTLEAWRAAVPESFRFAVKASRRITHFGRLADVQDATHYLLQSLQVLGERLGVVLFQLPPNMSCDGERLQRFLELLDGRVATAFEFRHPSWFRDSVYQLLQQHESALCIGDPDDKAPLAPQLLTAPHTYVRLRKDRYSDEEIAAWAARLRELGPRQAFVFFKHELLGPEYALKLAQQPGLGDNVFVG